MLLMLLGGFGGRPKRCGGQSKTHDVDKRPLLPEYPPYEIRVCIRRTRSTLGLPRCGDRAVRRPATPWAYAPGRRALDRL